MAAGELDDSPAMFVIDVIFFVGVEPRKDGRRKGFVCLFQFIEFLFEVVVALEEALFEGVNLEADDFG